MARKKIHGKWIDLAEKNGITAKQYYNRVGRDWSKERAATQKPKGHTKSPRITEEEKAYICKFYEWDGPAMIGYALNKNSKVIAALYSRYQKKGLVDYYRNLWDKQFIETEVKTGSGWF